MKVYLLFNCEDRLEGVYTLAGKNAKDEELMTLAIQNRERVNQTLTAEILELKELRRPYLTEADLLLEKEREARETNHTGHLKEFRKQRKVLLRQADKLTAEIGRRETKIRNSMLLMKKDLLSRFGQYYYWEDYYVEGEPDNEETC